MNKYNYYLSLTSQFYFCGIPFRLDTKPKCELNCTYCYAMARGGRRTKTNLIAEPKSLERLFKKVNNKTINSLNTELISLKIPLHFGGMCDPFDSQESIKVSLKLLKLLCDEEYPTILSTKNVDALLQDEVLNVLLNHKKIIIQVSFSGYSDDIARKIEPNVPSPEKRLIVLNKLKGFGLPTVVRLQPIIPYLTKDIVDNLIPKINEFGVDHLILEHLKLPIEKNIGLINDLNKVMKWDLYSLYDKLGSKPIGREIILSNEFKYKNLQRIISNLNPKITYSFADYGLQHLGQTRCCCGIDKFWPDSNFFKGNIVNCIKDNIDKEMFTLDLLINNNYPNSSISRVMNSHSRLKNSKSVKDYLIEKWNSPGKINAPDHMYGVTYFEKDINGNCIYKFDAEYEKD